MLHFVPSMLNIFIKCTALNSWKFPNLKTVISSGEKLEITTANEFKKVFEAKLFNLYGPAECTIDVTAHECGDESDDIPIGCPADNTEIYILNDNDKIMPVDIYGEICIVGELVGKGYAEGSDGGYFSFKGKRAYKTGDIGRLGCDGKIYISGRKDRQVKIRGMRINLSDIKNIVLNHNGITDAEVIKNDNRIECYFCGECDIEVIKKSLLKNLQVYAVPSRFIRVNEIPVTKNGKSDIKALTALNKKSQEETEALTANEKTVLNEVKKYIDANVNDNVFEKGLDSISILEIVCTLREKGININFSDFYEGLSVRSSLKIAENKRYYKYIKEAGSDKLMICFPFGGGEPQSLEGLFEDFKIDVMGVYTSIFDENTSVDAMINLLINTLPLENYKEIYLYGQCVGAVPALELADKAYDKAKGIFLVSPSVKLSKLKISPWDHIPINIISKILVKAGGDEKTYTYQVLKNFKKDTRRYFKYTPKIYKNIKCPINMIFGDKDIFTKNSKVMIKGLKKYVNSNINVHYIKDGKHFLNISDKYKLLQIINKFI